MLVQTIPFDVVTERIIARLAKIKPHRNHNIFFCFVFLPQNIVAAVYIPSQTTNSLRLGMHLLHQNFELFQGFPKLTSSCSHFSKILLTSVHRKASCEENNGKNGYSVQGLVAKVKDTVANG